MVKKETGLGIISGIYDYVKNFSNKVQDFAVYTEEKIIQIFYASALFLMGLIFLSIAFVFLMSEYLILSKGWSFLIIGLIAIIASLIMKNKALKDLTKRR